MKRRDLDPSIVALLVAFALAAGVTSPIWISEHNEPHQAGATK